MFRTLWNFRIQYTSVRLWKFNGKMYSMVVAYWTVISLNRGSLTNQHARLKFFNLIVLENLLPAETCAFVCIVTNSLNVARFHEAKYFGQAQYKTNICTRIITFEWTMRSWDRTESCEYDEKYLWILMWNVIQN